MPSPNNYLPVIGPDNELLYYAPIATVPGLLERDLVDPVGTSNRIRKLRAKRGSLELLRDSRPHSGFHFTHRGESADNPPRVWTFKKLHDANVREARTFAAAS